MRWPDSLHVDPGKASRARIGLSFLAALIGFGAFGETPSPARWVEARPGWLFRSRQIPASDVATVLRKQKIDVVIDLSDDPIDPIRDAEAAAADELGILYLHVPVSSGAERQIEGFGRAVAGIAQAHARGERVLVHCKLGHRRSAMAIALYARIVEDAAPQVAYRELMRFADPSADWQTDAKLFLERHLPAIERRVEAELAHGPDRLTRASAPADTSEHAEN
jgi:protein-tyrosine phosphatase